MHRVLIPLHLFGVTTNIHLHYFHQERSDEKRQERQIALRKHSSAFIHLPKEVEVHLVLTQSTMSLQKNAYTSWFWSLKLPCFCKKDHF